MLEKESERLVREKDGLERGEREREMYNREKNEMEVVQQDRLILFQGTYVGNSGKEIKR